MVNCYGKFLEAFSNSGPAVITTSRRGSVCSVIVYKSAQLPVSYDAVKKIAKACHASYSDVIAALSNKIISTEKTLGLPHELLTTNEHG